MTDNPFPPRLRVASVVRRWSIIWTHAPDNIAAHSFFTIYYADAIARLIDWPGDKYRLVMGATLHDMDECVTGDIVGVVKHEIIEPQRAGRFVNYKMMETMTAVEKLREDYHYPTRDPEMRQIHAIIKAADRLDALLFALVERALGNKIIEVRIPSLTQRLDEAWFRMREFVAEDQLMNLWETVVMAAVNDHSNPANYDVDRK